MSAGVGRSVRFAVPAEVAFDYLVDPVNRPAWQSSLRRVDAVDPGGPRVGQRWVDVTVPGLRPQMTTTALERPVTWTEIGVWRGIDAELTLDFGPDPDAADGQGCLVVPTFRVTGRGLLRLPAVLVDKVAVYAVVPDLRRAATILARTA